MQIVADSAWWLLERSSWSFLFPMDKLSLSSVSSLTLRFIIAASLFVFSSFCCLSFRVLFSPSVASRIFSLILYQSSTEVSSHRFIFMLYPSPVSITAHIWFSGVSCSSPWSETNGNNSSILTKLNIPCLLFTN